MRNTVSILFVASLTVLVACSGKSAGTDACDDNSDCNPGDVCRDGVCKAICNVDGQCEPGYMCRDSLCVPDSGTAPRITGVDGDSTLVCTNDPKKQCVFGGLVVTGEHLAAATWELTPSSGGSAMPLATDGPATETQVTLDLPDGIVQGEYVLTATVGSSSADQLLQVLQGEPGPRGPEGPEGPMGALDQTQIDAMNAAIAAAAPPVGLVAPFGGPSTAVPEGWLLCDGSQVSRTTYGALFAVVGTSHGGGDGVSTFHLPDYRGRFLRGVDAGAGGDPDAAGRTAPQPGNVANGVGNAGDQVGSLQSAATALPAAPLTTSNPGSHQHTFRVSTVDDGNNCCNNNSLASPGDTGALANSPNTGAAGAHTHTIGGGDIETRPLNAYVNWIIKY